VNNTNNFSARESYMIARDIFFKAMRNKFSSDKDCWAYVDSLKLSQGEIRLEVELTGNSSQFVFGMTANQANSNNVIFPTERRLTLQDTLVASEYGIYLGKPADRDDVEFALRTYPNPVDFTAAAAAALEGGFYSNGSFEMKCNNDVIIPYRGLLNHLYRGQTQQTGALGVGSPNDQFRGAEDGLITEEPNILLIGSKGYVPAINLPANLSTVDQYTRAVLIFKGILAQNSTIVN
jgi:hypothetical protein